MSSQIMHPMYTTTRVPRKVISGKPLTASQRKHKAFVESITKGRVADKALMKKQFLQNYRENMVVDRSSYNSAGMTGSSDACTVKGVMANIHKETPEVQKQIMDKASRTAPGWNKGGYVYITDSMDPKTLGRKV